MSANDYYSVWTSNLKEPAVIRQSPNGPAIEMAYNFTRSPFGMVLVGYPSLDVAKWECMMTVNTWATMTDVAPSNAQADAHA